MVTPSRRSSSPATSWPLCQRQPVPAQGKNGQGARGSVPAWTLDRCPVLRRRREDGREAIVKRRRRKRLWRAPAIRCKRSCLPTQLASAWVALSSITTWLATIRQQSDRPPRRLHRRRCRACGLQSFMGLPNLEQHPFAGFPPEPARTWTPGRIGVRPGPAAAARKRSSSVRWTIGQRWRSRP